MSEWITNVRDSIPVPMRTPEGIPFTGHRGDSICVMCGEAMAGCWDTVCCECGDTSCYEHSIQADGRWYCLKCGTPMLAKATP